MKQYDVLLLDDDENHLEYLKILFGKYPSFFKIKKAANTFYEAYEFLTNHVVDISIIDNELDDYKSFIDLLDRVPHEQFGIFYVTSSKHEDVINKQFGRDIKVFPKPCYEEDILTLIHSLNKVEKQKSLMNLNSYVISEGVEDFIIPYKDICYIQSSDKDTFFFCDGDTLENSSAIQINEAFGLELNIPALRNKGEGISEVEKNLNSDIFFRCHRFYIINLTRLKWSTYENGIRTLYFYPKKNIHNENFHAFAGEHGNRWLEQHNYVYSKKKLWQRIFPFKR